MSLHSRIYVPGVSRTAPGGLSSTAVGVRSSFVPPAQNRASAITVGSDGAAAALSGTTPQRGGAADAFAGKVALASPEGAAHTSSSVGLAHTGGSRAFITTPTKPHSLIAAVGPNAAFGPLNIDLVSSLPQPPPFAGRSSSLGSGGGGNTNGGLVSLVATPLLASTTTNGGAKGFGSGSNGQPCSASEAVSFCPCCGQRGRFVHFDEGDTEDSRIESSASHTLLRPSPLSHQSAAESAPIFDFTKRAPTAFKLYCDSVEPALIAKKMSIKDRKTSMTNSYEALPEGEKTAFEAKAAAAAKELKLLRKKASGQKADRTDEAGGQGGADVQPAPKRTKTSFMIFADDMRASVMEKLKAQQQSGGSGKVNIADVGRALGDMWKALSEDEKRAYTARADALKKGAEVGGHSEHKSVADPAKRHDEEETRQEDADDPAEAE